jgi:hypothetical protein
MTDDLVKRLREQSSEMSRADYWEAQASMWHENYKEAMAHEEKARRYKVALERIRDCGYGTKERVRQIVIKALGEKKDDQ